MAATIELYRPEDVDTLLSEQEAEDVYREMLEDVYGTVEVCGYAMDAARVFEQADPIAWRQGFLDYVDGWEVYTVPLDTYLDADFDSAAWIDEHDAD